MHGTCCCAQDRLTDLTRALHQKLRMLLKMQLLKLMVKVMILMMSWMLWKQLRLNTTKLIQVRAVVVLVLVLQLKVREWFCCCAFIVTGHSTVSSSVQYTSCHSNKVTQLSTPNSIQYLQHLHHEWGLLLVLPINWHAGIACLVDLLMCYIHYCCPYSTLGSNTNTLSCLATLLHVQQTIRASKI